MEDIMKAIGIAMLPQVADLREAGAFAPTAPEARRGGVVGRRSFWQRIATWRRVSRERQRLRDLDPRILHDIGVTPEEAAREASRPFWDVNGLR
jgi:uncharacterized protein YjiS (DUF1127 family)